MKRKEIVYNFYYIIIEGFYILEIEFYLYDSREFDKEYLDEIYEIYEVEGFIFIYFIYISFNNFILLYDFIFEFIDKNCY